MSTVLSSLSIMMSLVSTQTQSNQKQNIELIEKAMKATGFNSELTESKKSFMVPFEHDNKNIQNVFVSTTGTEKFGMINHSIYTDCYTSKTEIPEPILRKVFSSSKKMGQFYLFKDSAGTNAIRFRAVFDVTLFGTNPVATDSSAKNFKDTIYFVNAVGYETRVAITKMQSTNPSR